MKVKDVMHKGVDWVSPNTPVTELAKLMREHDIGCIPIGEDDRLIGMVTDRDIVCKGLASNNFDAGRAMARDVMTEGIHCCREDDDLAKAVHHMEKLKLRRLPVMNKSKRMVGIISLGDVSHSASGDVAVRVRQERFGPSLKHGLRSSRDSRQAARSDVETRLSDTFILQQSHGAKSRGAEVLTFAREWRARSDSNCVVPARAQDQPQAAVSKPKPSSPRCFCSCSIRR